ncbi:Chromatin assembly factor 1 subunit A [Portunus trituberculatus]|uniref:Chromatin assembly factor 1 subunit A n=1 Tax=Portunus trituberculatus TaxID=210409 RepID=A0A5B7EDK0_PORTR|nr:Chromatin assembly factor 1 subunit A [Portunus trituberculatus]
MENVISNDFSLFRFLNIPVEFSVGAKRQKKEEEQQRKEEEKKLKEEEKRVKEEEKRVKEEEKRVKEEEKRMKEEEKQKQEDKLKHRFASFFLAKKRDVEDEEERDTAGIFKQFRVKEDMQLAPLHRNTLTSDQHEALGEVMMGAQGGQGKLPLTYLALLKAGGHKVRSSARTWPPSTANDDDDDDIEIVDDDDDTTTTATATAPPQKGCPAPPGLRGCGAGRAKLLSFCENRRPAYWGTWSKAGQCVRARRPFLKEPTLDYEYDSNDDWEEEEAGESLSDSEGEEKEEEDNYEVDNDFFVPHGYLSDDEGKEEEEEKNCVKSGDGEGLGFMLVWPCLHIYTYSILL